MASFKFKSTKKALDIEGKEYIIDIGDPARLKAFLSKVGTLEALAQSLDANDPDIADKLVMVEKEAIEATVGDWERLWELSEHNVFGMLALVRCITEELTAGIQSAREAYGI